MNVTFSETTTPKKKPKAKRAKPVEEPDTLQKGKTSTPDRMILRVKTNRCGVIFTNDGLPDSTAGEGSGTNQADSGGEGLSPLKRVSTMGCLQQPSTGVESGGKDVWSSSSGSSSSEFEFLEAELEILENPDGIETCVDDLTYQTNFCVLTPIQEGSETSSTSTESNATEKKSGNFNKSELRVLSSSFCAVSAPREVEDPLSKSQTFPRSRPSFRSQKVNIDSTLYPLEPRELDPSCFHQLHAADSQDELYEFLLLESECMVNDGARGLAAAFTPPESDDVGTNSEGERESPKGSM